MNKDEKLYCRKRYPKAYQPYVPLLRELLHQWLTIILVHVRSEASPGFPDLESCGFAKLAAE